MIEVNTPKQRPPLPNPSEFDVKTSGIVKRCDDWELKREIDRINREYQDYDYD